MVAVSEIEYESFDGEWIFSPVDEVIGVEGVATPLACSVLTGSTEAAVKEASTNGISPVFNEL